MDDYQAIERRQRMRDIRNHAVALFMLCISLFALYTHMFYLALIPMFWLTFKVGKEKGREEVKRSSVAPEQLQRPFRQVACNP